jgi:AcrR family transcriptional regulator
MMQGEVIKQNSPSLEPEKRRKIISAARELFAQKRYDDVTVPEIVKLAGVAQGTFYRYFESKTKLVEALSEDIQRDLNTEIQKIVTEGKPFVELLELIVQTLLKISSSYQDVLPFMNTEAMLFADSQLADKQREPYLNVIAQLLERDQANGKLPKHLNPQLTARLLDNLIGRVVRDCVLYSDKLHVEEYLKETVDFVKRALQK